eukprot:TRINITY_DN250_c0_g1_i6.p3 TRINITY_DN250_c0_g1~~TRINITY_DN250_c0_g1_i6.p3  ORF type:complete len:195 (-),score=28.09 TRINITY_DN250_c0_g1_i6:397-981(-)
MKLTFTALTFVVSLLLAFGVNAQPTSEGITIFGNTPVVEAAPAENKQAAFISGIQDLNDVSTFIELLKNASEVETIDITAPYTIFVPNNQGFDEYFSAPGRTYEDLTANRQTLLGLILRYHIVQGAALRAEDLQDGQTLDTLGNQSLQVRKEEEKVTIVGFRTEGEVVQANITIGEIVVHIVDAVLLPNVVFKS